MMSLTPLPEGLELQKAGLTKVGCKCMGKIFGLLSRRQHHMMITLISTCLGDFLPPISATPIEV